MLTGSCLCNAVAYAADQLDKPIIHCHCDTCRKAQGAAFVPTAGVLREHFRWTRGQELLTSYESSPGKLRWFCSRCGSHLMAERPAMPLVIVRVATLDTDPGQRPQAHIWQEHDKAWLRWEGVPGFAQWHEPRD